MVTFSFKSAIVIPSKPKLGLHNVVHLQLTAVINQQWLTCMLCYTVYLFSFTVWIFSCKVCDRSEQRWTRISLWVVTWWQGWCVTVSSISPLLTTLKCVCCVQYLEILSASLVHFIFYLMKLHMFRLLLYTSENAYKYHISYCIQNTATYASESCISKLKQLWSIVLMFSLLIMFWIFVFSKTRKHLCWYLGILKKQTWQIY